MPYNLYISGGSVKERNKSLERGRPIKEDNTIFYYQDTHNTRIGAQKAAMDYKKTREYKSYRGTPRKIKFRVKEV